MTDFDYRRLYRDCWHKERRAPFNRAPRRFSTFRTGNKRSVVHPSHLVSVIGDLDSSKGK